MRVMMAAVRRLSLFQSTSWLAVVAAAASKAAHFDPVVAHHHSHLIDKAHGYTQIFEESVCQFRVVAHSAEHYAVPDNSQQYSENCEDPLH